MRFSRQPRAGPLLAWLALGLNVGAAGCSDDSGRSGTLAPVREADKEAAQKSAEIRKEEMRKKAMQPRSKKVNRD